MTPDNLAELERHEAEVHARFQAQAQRIAELEAERDRLRKRLEAVAAIEKIRWKAKTGREQPKESADQEELAIDLGVKLIATETDRDRLAKQRQAVLALAGQEYTDAGADIQAGGSPDQLDDLTVPVHDLLVALGERALDGGEPS